MGKSKKKTRRSDDKPQKTPSKTKKTDTTVPNKPAVRVASVGDKVVKVPRAKWWSKREEDACWTEYEKKKSSLCSRSTIEAEKQVAWMEIANCVSKIDGNIRNWSQVKEKIRKLKRAANGKAKLKTRSDSSTSQSDETSESQSNSSSDGDDDSSEDSSSSSSESESEVTDSDSSSSVSNHSSSSSSSSKSEESCATSADVTYVDPAYTTYSLETLTHNATIPQGPADNKRQRPLSADGTSAESSDEPANKVCKRVMQNIAQIYIDMASKIECD